MDYKLVRHKGQRYLKLYFGKEGELIVSSPYNIGKTKIEEFVAKNKNWIDKQSQKQQKHSFSTSDVLFYMGKKYDLVVNQSSKDSLQILENLMLVYSTDPAPEYVKKIVRKYYEQSLEAYAKDRCSYWCNVIRVGIPELKIRNTRSRWGCCAKSKNLIEISLMTATLNERLIDMIVLHEVCHLVYANHQKEFWTLMSDCMEDLAERKLELKRISRQGFHRNLF